VPEFCTRYYKKYFGLFFLDTVYKHDLTYSEVGSRLSDFTALQTDRQTDVTENVTMPHLWVITKKTHKPMVQNWIYFEYLNFRRTSHCRWTSVIKECIQSELHTYWKLTLSIENRVSNMPDVKTRQRRMSYAAAMHRNKHMSMIIHKHTGNCFNGPRHLLLLNTINFKNSAVAVIITIIIISSLLAHHLGVMIDW